jgi:hypothetical protein
VDLLKQLVSGKQTCEVPGEDMYKIDTFAPKAAYCRAFGPDVSSLKFDRKTGGHWVVLLM